jgi:hypothetical protein
MDHNHLKKERGTWPVSILPALQSIDSNGNQSPLCCKLLYMCSTLLDVNNSGHTTTLCSKNIRAFGNPFDGIGNRSAVSQLHTNMKMDTRNQLHWVPGCLFGGQIQSFEPGFFFALDHTWPHCQERHYTQEAAFWHAFRLHLIHCVLISSALEMILWIGWGFRASFLCYESIRKLASTSWSPLCLSKESPMWICTVNYPPPPPSEAVLSFCRGSIPPGTSSPCCRNQHHQHPQTYSPFCISQFPQRSFTTSSSSLGLPS